MIPRPNVILITCHDLGDEISPYGVPAATPCLAAMAGQGVVLANHCSTGSVCSPARGSIMTGCYPHTHGLMGLLHRGWTLDVARCPTIPILLADVGYEILLFGFQHEHYDPSKLGYQSHVRPAGGNAVECVVPAFNDWLLKRHDRRPFFAAIGFNETHRMGPPNYDFRREIYEPADAAEVLVPPYLPDIAEVREDLRWFHGAANLVDRMLGTLMETLDERGLSGETILVFTSDHGASFMHGKATLYDGGMKVACLMRWPGGLPSGRRVNALTSHVDVLPTLLELLNVDVPPHVQGRSFAAAARGEADRACQYAFSEKNYTNYYAPARSVRACDFKYIRKGLRTCIYDFVIPELELCASGFRKNRAVFEFYSARRTSEELYDLGPDPGEMHNVAADPAYRGKLDALRAVLDAHLERTDDPFRHLRNDLLMPESVYDEVRGPARA